MKNKKFQCLTSFLLVLTLLFSCFVSPVQAKADDTFLSVESASSEDLYSQYFSEPDNPIVSQEPYLPPDGEIAVYDSNDATLVTYADGTEAIVSAIPLNTEQESEARGWQDKLLCSVKGDGNGKITITFAATLITWGTDLDVNLYYGTCRTETPNTHRNTWKITSLGLTNAVFETTISTTKYFRLRVDGTMCGDVLSADLVKFLMNKKASPYPKYTCPVSGKICVGPYYTYFAKTTPINWNGRNTFIRYFNNTYNNGKDPWNWDNYDIRHIRPRGFGGLNDNGNLIPLPKATHTKFTTWWKSYA